MYDLNKIREYMDTSVVGNAIVQFDNVLSTANKAKNILNKCPDGAVVLAENQENCKVRFGRQWHSYFGKNIYMSIIFKPEEEFIVSKAYALVTAAVCSAVSCMFDGVSCTVKWPNDLYIRGLKICSTAVEDICKKDRQVAVVASILINVNMEISELDENLKPFVSTMKEVLEVAVNREMLIGYILKYVEEYYDEFKKNNTVNEAIDICMRSSSIIGMKIELIKRNKKTPKYVLAQSVDSDGWLIVVNERGNEEIINPGDVSVSYEI